MGNIQPGAKAARRTFTGGVHSAEQNEDLMLGSARTHMCVCARMHDCVLGQRKGTTATTGCG